MRKKYFKTKDKACPAKLQRSRGFTIIETMIAVALFLVVVMSGMGALMNASFIHEKSQDTRSIMDNLSFIMEDMSRNIRTGYNYHCIDNTDDLDNSLETAKSGGISQNCQGIAFESSTGDSQDSNDQWVYVMGTYGSSSITKIFKSTKGPYSDVSNYNQLTPDEININSTASGFTVIGAESGDNQQPFVIIRLVGNIHSNKNNTDTPFSLQTSVSQRLVDI